MVKATKIQEIPLDNLVIGQGQVRVQNVGAEIDELAESIRVMGLLEPIVVCPAREVGKFEILTGQRRFLAHKQLQKSHIAAVVLDERVDADTAKAISVTENMVRRDLSQKELIDACTALYRKYGSIAHVAETTGLPANKVSHYVKYDRLIPELKQLIDGEGVPLKVALRAQDAASVSGAPNATEAVELARQMAGMSGVQQKKVVAVRTDDPSKTVVDVIEEARTGSKVTQVIVTLSATHHKALQTFARSEQTNQDEAAATLIEEGLAEKGFLAE